jgi:hypothetical protein
LRPTPSDVKRAATTGWTIQDVRATFAARHPRIAPFSSPAFGVASRAVDPGEGFPQATR